MVSNSTDIFAEQLGLSLVRQGLGSELAEELEQELISLAQNPADFLDDYLVRQERWPGVDQINFSAASLIGDSLPIIQTVVDRKNNAGKPYSATVVKYAPGAEQGFHVDTGTSDRAILNASGGGAFDFVVDTPESERDVRTIALSAGDIVLPTRYLLEHRGRNPTSHTRYVLFRYTKQGS